MGTSHRVPRGRRGKRRGFYIMVVRKWVAKRARRRYRGPGYARMENRRASLLQHRRPHGQPRQGCFAKEMLRCSVFNRLVAHHRFSRIRITVAAKAQDGRQSPARDLLKPLFSAVRRNRTLREATLARQVGQRSLNSKRSRPSPFRHAAITRGAFGTPN